MIFALFSITAIMNEKAVEVEIDLREIL